MRRTWFVCRWFAATAAAAALLVLLAACTTSIPTPPSLAPATATNAPHDSRVPPEDQTVRLSCADAGAGDVPVGAGNLTVAPITLEGLAANVRGSRPDDVGVTVSAPQALYFFKSPAWLAAGASITTIELLPSSGGYLVWVPAPLWTGGGDLMPWMASKVVFDGCPDRDSTYFGGLLSADPNICLTLRISDATGESRDVAVGSAAQCS